MEKKKNFFDIILDHIGLKILAIVIAIFTFIVITM